MTINEHNPFAVQTTKEPEAMAPAVVKAAEGVRAEIQAAITVALNFPRSESRSFERLIASCQRASFAQGTRYSFKRGGAEVSGPSVKIAREAGRCWGNVRWGLDVIDDSGDERTIQGWAWDLETNTKVEAQDSFRKVVQRKDRQTGVTRDEPAGERDIRELTNKRGAILIRNCILQLLPPDLIDAAMDCARRTMEGAAGEELKTNRRDVIKRTIEAFGKFSVTVPMLEAHLGHPLEDVNDAGLADLREIFQSLRDGNTTREDHFTVKAAPQGKPAGSMLATEPPETEVTPEHATADSEAF